MNKSSKIVVIVSFLILFLLLWANHQAKKEKEENFRSLSNEIRSYDLTSKDRVGNAVVTLPDGQIIVGLKNNIGSYTYMGNHGTLTIDTAHIKTEFISGVYGVTDPRTDAIAAMYVDLDSHGGSMYIVLFNDRGDAALEKSYARLGGKNVIIQNIDTLPGDENEEYKVHITYNLESRDQKSGLQTSVPKEVIIPVVNGHFDPEKTISK